MPTKAELEVENTSLRAEIATLQKDLLAAQKDLLSTLKSPAVAVVSAVPAAEPVAKVDPTVLAPGEVFMGCRNSGCKSKKHRVEAQGQNKLYVCVLCSNTQSVSVGGSVNL